MATYQLRQMSLGEILDGALAIFRSAFATLVTIVIVCQGIPAIINTYVVLGGGVVQHPILWVASTLIGALGGLLSAAATVWVISEAYLGEEAIVGDALSYALKRMGALFVAGLAKYLLMFLAMLFFIVPGIIVACGYAVVTQVVVLEGGAPTDALSRSWKLTKGYKGKVFGLGAVVFALIYIPFMIFGALTAVVPGLQVTFQIGAQLISLMVYPIVACAFTLLYYDLRVRKEAFDLEHLSQQIGLGAEPTGA